MKRKISFGRVFKKDKRDKKFLLQAPKRASRQYKYWKPGTNLDQGNTSACVGYAWAGWFNCSPVRQNPIKPFGIYTLSKFFDEWNGEDYEGTSVRGGANVLLTTGHVVEYRWCWDLNTAVNWVLTKGPLVLGTNWYSGMMDTDKNGFVYATGSFEGGHATLLYGANKKEKFVTIRNSWGREWGDNGNCRLGFEDFTKLLSEDGECCAATETKQ